MSTFMILVGTRYASFINCCELIIPILPHEVIVRTNMKAATKIVKLMFPTNSKYPDGSQGVIKLDDSSINSSLSPYLGLFFSGQNVHWWFSVQDFFVG